MARRRVSAQQSARTLRSVEIGHRLAAAVRRQRAAALRQRAEAIATAPLRARARAVPIAPRFMRAAGPSGIGTLVAEGDSWFDYLWWDILNVLEDEYGYDVASVASAGDRVEDMAYSGGQLVRFRKVLEKLLRRAELPKAVLLSGGGNDVAGTAFSMLLDHADSAMPGLNDDVVRGVVDVRVRNAYITMITAVTDLCVSTTGHTIPILVHGYDRPVPDGRGFAGGWPFPGPWLRPGFHAKAHLSQAKNTTMMGTLIDRFNAMLAGVAADPRFPHVRYVDLRGTLPNGSSYEKWWANELHPTQKGFKAVAERFAAAIAAVNPE